MEVPGGDVTADPLEPQPESLPPNAPRREDNAPREAEDDTGDQEGV
jgi:hypothetical protein